MFIFLLTPHMKLHQVKVSFSIRPAVFLPGGWADSLAENLIICDINLSARLLPSMGHLFRASLRKKHSYLLRNFIFYVKIISAFKQCEVINPPKQRRTRVTKLAKVLECCRFKKDGEQRHPQIFNLQSLWNRKKSLCCLDTRLRGYDGISGFLRVW